MKLRIVAVLFFSLLMLIGCSSDTKSLKIVPSSHDFGMVYLGDYVEKDFVLTNQFNDVLRIDVLKVEGNSDYVITSGDTVPISIPGKASHTVTIRFIPSNQGIQQAVITIMHDKATKPKYVDLVGSGQKAARIEIPETNFDYGVVVNNTSKSHDFEIKSVGTSDLVLNSFNFVGPNSSLFSVSAGGNVPITITPGTSHIVTVDFSPLANGNYATTLQISHNAVNGNNPYEINIDGEGVDVNPMITLNQSTSWDFGNIASILFSTQICEIENTGTDPLTITSGTLSTNAEFTIDSLKDGNANIINFPQTLQPSDKIFLSVKFAPGAINTFNDTLTFVHDGNNEISPWDISLSATGHQAQTKTWNVSKTKESWTIPTDTTAVRIEVWGAEGGGTGYGVPGKGARMRGDFNVKPGDVLTIAVGEQGLTGGKGGGGGGGSFVALGTQPLIIAGGGGGTHTNSSSIPAKDGVTTATCTPNNPTGTGYKAASGGGWSQDGANGTYGSIGGKSWSNGLIGGTCCTGGYSHWSRGDGGFGGGGGGSWAPGSAGGYNGGVSADCGSGTTPGGTGGGSINNGANQDNTAGAQSGDGKVVITY